MSEENPPRQILLTGAQTHLAAGGTFVRVDFGFYAKAADGSRFRSAFVASLAPFRSGNGAEARWVAYANICRHHPVELDVPEYPVDAASGVRLALIAQDGVSLMCGSHGAVYRPADGFCTTGPCFGQRLVPLDVVVEAGVVTLALPADSSVADTGKFT